MAIRMIPPISSAFILNRQPYRRASKMPSQDKVKETTPIISTVCHKLIFNRENDKPTAKASMLVATARPSTTLSL
jgi:hypothetical protein